MYNIKKTIERAGQQTEIERAAIRKWVEELKQRKNGQAS